MNFDPLQIGIFILAFVPGYIFIQTLDHHLLKGEKSQFEKTVQILLASTVIWLLAFSLPLFPVQAEKNFILSVIRRSIICNGQNSNFTAEFANNADKAVILFACVCLYSFFLANVWGVLRRIRRIDGFIRRLTKRDWYKTVSLRFFSENINATILLTKKDKLRYAGVLNGAPDDKNDNCIILVNPSIVEKNNGSFEFKKLAARSILVNLNEIELIEVIRKYERRRTCPKKKTKNSALEKASKEPDPETDK